MRFFCCILLLMSSAKSNHKEDNSEEEIKNELDKINEVLIELKSSIAENKLHGDKADAVHDQQIHQLLMEHIKSIDREDALKVEINHIKQVLKEFNEKTNSSLPIKKPEICYGALEFHEHEKPDYTWVITDLHQKLNQTDFEVLSEVFPLRGYPFEAQARLYLFHKYLKIQLSFKNGNESSETLPLGTLPAVVYTFKNHSENHHHSDRVIRHESQHFNTSLQFDSFSNGKWLIALESHLHMVLLWIPKYRVSNTVSIDIHVEPPQWSQRACSHDGTLIWAIEDYSKKLQMEKELSVFFQLSPYFYTGPNGYRVLAYFMLDGFEGTHRKGVSAFVRIVQGPNDKTLVESFKFRSTVTLLHPTDPNKDIVKSLDQGIEGEGPDVIDLGTYEEIEQLLDNDTLYYNVTVVEIQNNEF